MGPHKLLTKHQKLFIKRIHVIVVYGIIYFIQIVNEYNLLILIDYRILKSSFLKIFRLFHQSSLIQISRSHQISLNIIYI